MCCICGRRRLATQPACGVRKHCTPQHAGERLCMHACAAPIRPSIRDALAARARNVRSGTGTRRTSTRTLVQHLHIHAHTHTHTRGVAGSLVPGADKAENMVLSVCSGRGGIGGRPMQDGRWPCPFCPRGRDTAPPLVCSAPSCASIHPSIHLRTKGFWWQYRQPARVSWTIRAAAGVPVSVLVSASASRGRALVQHWGPVGFGGEREGCRGLFPFPHAVLVVACSG